MKTLRFAALLLATLVSTIVMARPQPSCDTTPPNEDDRAVFDMALVNFVRGAASTANDAAAIADSLLWARSQRFYAQPREQAQGPDNHSGAFYGPAWTVDEQMLWGTLVVSALNGGNQYHAADPKVADHAIYAAWEVMQHRRMYYTHACQ